MTRKRDRASVLLAAMVLVGVAEILPAAHLTSRAFAQSPVEDPGVCNPWFTPADVGGSYARGQLHPPVSDGYAGPPSGVQPLPPVDHEVDQALYRAPGGKGYIDSFSLDFPIRGYYLNDQRIQWSGLEATFGVEAALSPVIKRRFGYWEATAEGEFYLNEPFSRNVLVDTPQRRSYAGNFNVDTFEISKLLLALRNGDWQFTVGKMETPFGRTYFRLFSNARFDAPFIRTESILWRETGLLIRYDPGLLVCEAALANGCEGRDTNSSKALISRIGLESEKWAVGASVKVQDGIGSEGQKRFNNHLGMDFMLRWSRFTLSGEVIYDEYGFRRPGFDPDDVTWGRSIYYRDQNLRWGTPICGVGYYVDLGFVNERWTVGLNYGGFFPQEIGDRRHDRPTRRGIVKVAYGFAPGLEAYAVAIVENEGHIAQADRPRCGKVVLVGMQYAF